ncbi:MAG: hypothetical protein JJU37_12825 [Balneolaceae bacterium]|nr:hypothetical protein [Balneolaceae bacterium]
MNRKEWIKKTSILTAGGMFIPPILKGNSFSKEPIKVEIREQDDSFQLYRGGKPYYIKGAGGENHLELLVSIGGNSIRRWGTNENTMSLLNRAHELGISVCLGLNMRRERHGFDYDDEHAVMQQLEQICGEVEKYKNHPAVLMWGIGNELDLRYSNTKVWHAVNDVSKMIHDVDPFHLTTTMTAGIDKKRVDLIKEKCSDLDLLSINTYGSLPSLPANLRAYGWDKAYIVAEWGPTGHWEVPRTDWDAAIEETSTEKRKLYFSRYQESIKKDTEKCLGSYVFLWGQKQERTHTWYGMFMENGDPIEVIDAMEYNWTGMWPENRSPSIDSLTLNGKKAIENLSLQPNEYCQAEVISSIIDDSNIQINWEIFHESSDHQEGGDREQKPDRVDGLISVENTQKLRFNAPEQKGPYRIFVYIKNENINRVATANIPFFVE